MDFLEHLRKARIYHAHPALVDRRILPALIRLAYTPGQEGFVLEEEFFLDRREEISRELNGVPMSAAVAIIGPYDRNKSRLCLTIRTRDGYSRKVSLTIPHYQIERAIKYIKSNRKIGNRLDRPLTSE